MCITNYSSVFVRSFPTLKMWKREEVLVLRNSLSLSEEAKLLGKIPKPKCHHNP
jgi:hypothetical protein